MTMYDEIGELLGVDPQTIAKNKEAQEDSKFSESMGEFLSMRRDMVSREMSAVNINELKSEEQDRVDRRGRTEVSEKVDTVTRTIETDGVPEGVLARLAAHAPEESHDDRTDAKRKRADDRETGVEVL